MSAQDTRPTFFATTRWTLICEAADEGDTRAVEALGALMTIYWQPLYRYARRKGKSKEDAEDLVQGFLVHLMEARTLRQIDRGKGRFRAFLLTAFNHWMINEWRHECSGKPRHLRNTRRGDCRWEKTLCDLPALAMPEDDLFSLSAQPENPAPVALAFAEHLRPRLSKLAEQGIYVGTSSWKYPGWCGQIYDEQRYLTRGKFSEAKFNRACLAEYGQTFKSVCVDAGYYQFPTEKYLAELCADVPEGFRFGFKVTDDITIKKFPGHARFGVRAGTFNENFLNARLFKDLFLAPCEPFRDKIGPLIFEFSQFHKHEFEHGSQFVAALDSFFANLPKGWEYGVEIRNKKWLVPEYFAMLRSHGVAHVYNNWTRMPSIGEQMEMEGSETADFIVARFLLTPGRTYETAVRDFQPYTATKEIDIEARKAAQNLVIRCVKKGRKLYIYINNRLEGSAPRFIIVVIDLDDFQPRPVPPLRDTLF